VAVLAAVTTVAVLGALTLASVAREDAGDDETVGVDAAPATQLTTPPAESPTSSAAESVPVAEPPPTGAAEAPAEQAAAGAGSGDSPAEAAEGQGGGQGEGRGQGNGGGAQGSSQEQDDDEEQDDDRGPGRGEAAVAALPAATVPRDWVEYRPDEAPYRVAHPPAWTIERLDATRTDIDDPSSSTYLRLDWTDDPAPDALADWQAYEPQFAEGREGYERIRMEPTTFKGEPAALWEYRYVRNGTTYHAYNLNVSGEDYGYALNYQTTEQEWADFEPVFGSFAESYEIRN
jgi:hypothetical protein